MSCTVCVETLNKSTRKRVTCPFCEYISCHLCTKTYLRDSYQSPHCMNCKKEWSNEFVCDHFTKVFLHTEYRTSREQILFEEEKTHLPEMQEEAARIQRLHEIDTMLNDVYRREMENEREEMQTVRQQRLNREALKTERTSLNEQRQTVLHRRVKTAKPLFLKKCPLGECRGFLSNEYMCGICQNVVCKSCHALSSEEHKCNPDDVATVAELARTTKPCPTCYIPIQKSDGCDQMFCIQCHTGFSWKTGLVETGVIHNPHYFEALRNGNIRDVRHRQEQGECGPIPPYTSVLSIVVYATERVRHAIQFYYQQIVHHRQVTLRLFEHTQDAEVRNDRIHYLVGRLDETKYKSNLYVRHQRNVRKQEERQIMDAFVTIGEELFRDFIKTPLRDMREACESLILQLRTLFDVTYRAVVDMDKRYTHKSMVLRPSMIRTALVS